MSLNVAAMEMDDAKTVKGIDYLTTLFAIVTLRGHYRGGWYVY